MAYQHVRALTVRIWGERVGVVQESARVRGAYVFQYDPEWVSSGRELAPVLMPLPTKPRDRSTFVFSPAEYPELTFRGLPPMLADALPDRFGNSIVNLALTEMGVGDVSQITALDRLAYIGSRAMGALTFEPDGSPRVEPSSIHLSRLVESARSVIDGSFGDEKSRAEALHELIAVGSSPGGARAKALIALHPDTQEVRAGSVASPDGFEQWLLKFDGVGEGHSSEPEGYTNVEFAYAQMARSAGVEMMQTRLLLERERQHFLTRRFDRPGATGERLHLQTLCALTGDDFNHIGDEHRGVPSNRYESYFATARKICGDNDAMLEQMFRRMAFNVLASNCDDHTKNHSFLMDKSGTWTLAPAYDITFAYNPASKWTARHLMSVGGKTDVITVADMMNVGKEFAVPKARSLIDEVYEGVRMWDAEAGAAGVPDKFRVGFGARMESVARESGIDGPAQHPSQTGPGAGKMMAGNVAQKSKSRAICGAKTVSGLPCRNYADSCPQHQNGR